MITMKMAGKNGTYQPMKNHSKEGSSSSQGLLHPSTIPLTTGKLKKLKTENLFL